MKFKALENGTLSEPYRFIEKDRIIDSSELPPGFKGRKWLVPLEEALKIPVRPLTSVTHMPTQNGLDAMKSMEKAMPVVSSYERNIDALRKIEARQDAESKPVQPEAPAEPKIVIPGEEQVGTGNQEVA